MSPRGTPRQPQADTHVEYVQQPLTYLQCEGNHCCGNVSESRIFLGPRFSNLSVKKTDGNIPTRTELNTVANRCDVFSTPFQTRNAEVFLYSVLLVTDRIFLFFFFFALLCIGPFLSLPTAFPIEPLELKYGREFSKQKTLSLSVGIIQLRLSQQAEIRQCKESPEST